MYDPWLGHDPRELIARLKSLTADLEVLASGGRPDGFGEYVDLNNWHFVKRSNQCLSGVIVSHPEIPDNASAITSQIYYLDQRTLLARTFSRWYRLGVARPDEDQ